MGLQNSPLVPLLGALAATVEGRHGFVGRADLDLKKEGLVARACGALGLGPVHIGPCVLSTQYVVNLLPLCLDLGRVDLRDRVHIGAHGAAKLHAIFALLHQQQIATHGTEVHLEEGGTRI